MSHPVSQPIIRRAILEDDGDALAVVELLDLMAREPAGGGRALNDAIKRAVVPGLIAHPTTIVLLAWKGQKAVGMAVCYRGFSTFAARPLINIHDLVVHPDARRQGIGFALLQAVEDHARELRCCRLTLEVRGDNLTAAALYRRFGFIGGTAMADPATYAFLNKVLD